MDAFDIAYHEDILEAVFSLLGSLVELSEPWGQTETRNMWASSVERIIRIVLYSGSEQDDQESKVRKAGRELLSKLERCLDLRSRQKIVDELGAALVKNYLAPCRDGDNPGAGEILDKESAWSETAARWDKTYKT